jgi:hypothetical protein
MTWSGFAFGAIGAFSVWMLTEFVGRPFRRFFDLRADIIRRMVQFANVPARATDLRDGRREVNQLSDADEARLTEAQNTLRDLASQMRAFAQAEWLAELIVRHIFKFNAPEISTALIGYSNSISNYGQAQADFQSRVEKLLRIRVVAP